MWFYTCGGPISNWIDWKQSWCASFFSYRIPFSCLVSNLVSEIVTKPRDPCHRSIINPEEALCPHCKSSSLDSTIAVIIVDTQPPSSTLFSINLYIPVHIYLYNRVFMGYVSRRVLNIHSRQPKLWSHGFKKPTKYWNFYVLGCNKDDVGYPPPIT